MSRLSDAVADVIRGEWQFRVGPQSYSGKSQAWFEDAMEQLRRVATGYNDLDKAGRSLGCRTKVKRLRLKG